MIDCTFVSDTYHATRCMTPLPCLIFYLPIRLHGQVCRRFRPSICTTCVCYHISCDKNKGPLIFSALLRPGPDHLRQECLSHCGHCGLRSWSRPSSFGMRSSQTSSLSMLQRARTSIMHEHCAVAFEIVFRGGLGQLLAWNGGSIYLVKANPGCVIRPAQMGHGMGSLMESPTERGGRSSLLLYVPSSLCRFVGHSSPRVYEYA